MSSFDLWTEISIQVFAPHPVGRSDIQNTYTASELPPFVGTGLLIKPDATPERWGFQPGGQAWSPNLPSLPSGVTVGAKDRAFSLHEMKVGNKLGIAGVDPCLEKAPDVSEYLPDLISGVPDMSAISFRLVNPRFRRWFSSDFISIQTLVVVARVTEKGRLDVWRGMITKVTFIDGTVSISARPDMKRLDTKATFSFDDKILEWWPEYEIPIVSAVMIPYSVKVHRHAASLANSYDKWYSDFSELVGTPQRIDGKEDEYLKFIDEYIPSPVVPFDDDATEEELKQRRSLFASRINELSRPDYVSFDKKDLIRCVSYPLTQRKYKEGTNAAVDIANYDSGVFWVRVERGIFILPSEEDLPLTVSGVEAMERHPSNFRECSLPDGAGVAFDGGLLERVDFASVPFQINTGDSFCSWGVTGLSFDKQIRNIFSISEGFHFFDSQGNYRIPHPLDFMYKHEILGGLFSIFITYVVHGLDRFFQVAVDPIGYYRDHWMTYSRQDKVSTLFDVISQGDTAATKPTYGVDEFTAFLRRPKTYGLRSKDMYSTESAFKTIQSASTGNDVDLSEYSLSPLAALFSADNVLVPNSSYTGAASRILRLMPGMRREHFPEKDSTRLMNSPHVQYEQSANKGGAYMVSATYMLDSENSGLRDLRQAMLTTENIVEDFKTFTGTGRPTSFVNGPYVSMFRGNFPGEDDPTNQIQLYFLPLTSTGLLADPRGWKLPITGSSTALKRSSPLWFDTLIGTLDIVYYRFLDRFYVVRIINDRAVVKVVLTNQWTVYNTSDPLNNLNVASSVTTASIAVTDKYFYATVNLGDTGQKILVWDKYGRRVPSRDLLLGSLRVVDIYALNFGTYTEEDDYIFALTQDGRIFSFKGSTARQVERMRYTIEETGKFAAITGDYRGVNFYLYVLIQDEGEDNPFRVIEIQTSSDVERNLIWNDSLTYREGTDDEPQRRNWGNLFQYYYHHDMYGVHDAHLRPTTYVYAVLRNSHLIPGFQQDGSDVDGRINAHKMQMIESTDVTYRNLLKRLLPSLGYIVRFNPSTGKAELADIATNQNPKWQMGDNMIKIIGIESNFAQQYSSFFFENPDMIKGENTLEEWKNDALQQGKFTIFNSNPFVQGRNITIKTGTWTSEYEKVATILSIRKDLYTWEISNYSLLEISDKILGGPLVGDRVKLKSKQIPTESNEAVALIMSIRQTEVVTEYRGVVFAP